MLSINHYQEVQDNCARYFNAKCIIRVQLSNIIIDSTCASRVFFFAQNIIGLTSISSEDCWFNYDGNTILIYPNSPCEQHL